MAGRGPRSRGRPRTARPTQQRGPAGAGPGRDDALVRIHDLAGRPRGTGFVADHHGTVVTSHEAVDGLPRLVLHAAGDRSCVVTADAVTPLPDLDLALVRTEGLGVDPLPVTVRDRIGTGTYVRLPAGCWREARVLGRDPRDLHGHRPLPSPRRRPGAGDRHGRPGRAAAGRRGRRAARCSTPGPARWSRVLGTALQSGHRDVGFAVPAPPAPERPARRPARRERGDGPRVRRRPQSGRRTGTDGDLGGTGRPAGGAGRRTVTDGPGEGAGRDAGRTGRRRQRSSPRSSQGPAGRARAGRARPAAAVRPNSRPSPPAATAARNRPPPCGCAAPT